MKYIILALFFTLVVALPGTLHVCSCLLCLCVVCDVPPENREDLSVSLMCFWELFSNRLQVDDTPAKTKRTVRPP
ncbi:hypothetical protein DL96DRAFT_1623123 [Flagelloscypha sp. PMI_526]|nr:hypothetical protein DL96DRAFT_1623123 [Flagelloscypha sp. PMI_526]